MKTTRALFDEILYWLFLLAWATIGAMITVSKAVTSIAEIVLAVVCIIQFFIFFRGNWRDTLNWHFWSIVGVFLLFVIGLWNTSNFEYAFHDLRIKLPILILPLFYFVGQKIEKWQKYVIFAFFITGAIIASMIGFFKNLSELDNLSFDPRNLSPFVSHIRLSQALSISLLLIYYFITNLKHSSKWLLMLPGIWIIYFLNLSESLTALVGMMIVGATIVFLNFFLISKWLSRLLFIFIVIVTSLVTIQVYGIAELVFEEKYINNSKELATYTVNGNLYSHKLNEKHTENGYHLGMYLQEEELISQWNKVAYQKYDANINGFQQGEILRRYLTSKGLPKDSLGVAQLNESDIKAIQNGVANCYYTENSGIKERIHRTFWEINVWMKTGYANGKSTVLRMIYWSKGLYIWKNNFWTGVGTGDVNDEFRKLYAQNDHGLPELEQNRAHNLYLTVALTVGFPLAIVFAIFVISLYRITWKNAKFIGVGCISIIFIGLLYEDGIESQAGATLFAWVLLLISDFKVSLSKHKANSEGFD
jgi:O-antigen ligase